MFYTRLCIYVKKINIFFLFRRKIDMNSSASSRNGRQSWSPEDMQRAIEAAVSKQMGWLKASKTFNVPRNTLRRRVAGNNKVLKGSSVGFLGGSLPLFRSEIESEMVEHVKTLEARFFGLTPTDLRKLAYQLATKLNLKHRFNQDTKMAGWD